MIGVTVQAGNFYYVEVQKHEKKKERKKKKTEKLAVLLKFK